MKDRATPSNAQVEARRRALRDADLRQSLRRLRDPERTESSSVAVSGVEVERERQRIRQRHERERHRRSLLRRRGDVSPQVVDEEATNEEAVQPFREKLLDKPANRPIDDRDDDDRAERS